MIISKSKDSFEVIRPVRSEIESRLRGLVVRHVLRGDGEAVRNILHEAVDAVVCGMGCDIDSQFGAFLVPTHHLLAPIAEDVGRQTRVGLRSVVEHDAVELLQIDHLLVLLVVFRYRGTVEQLTQEVAVPPYPEIDRKPSAVHGNGVVVLRVVGVTRD